MIELSKRLIYEPYSLTRMHYLKEDVATVHLYQFLQYRDKHSLTAWANKVMRVYIWLVCLICAKGCTIK